MNQKEFPEEMRLLLKRLVAQKQLIIAATLLKAFFKRIWKLDDQLASYYCNRYFRKYFNDQLEKHLKRMSTNIMKGA